MAALASITAHKQFAFRINPYNISWGGNLRTHVDDTYGGKVVQILGVDLTTLSIDTASGAGGRTYLKEFSDFFRDMSLWQQNEQKVALFSFPAKKYRLNVWAQSLTIRDSLDNVEFPISMTFQIQDDLGGNLKKTAMTDTLKKMATGIGYTRNDFNYPSAAATAALDANLLTVNTSSTNTPTPNSSTVNGTDSSITAEQLANARIIIAVALATFPGAQGRLAAIIGVMAALTESGMKVINYGDTQNGVMTSSRGLFQQIQAWGPLSDRLDATKSSKMFFTGGQGGQPGLNSISGWPSLNPWNAAQAVQGSEFSSGSNYQANYSHSVSIVDNIINSNSVQSQTVVNGVNVTIPNNSNVDAAARGAIIAAPNAAVAKGLAAAFGMLGTPYVWGGGDGAGSGPNNGVLNGGRGGGAYNSGGSTIGFDCSGFAAYVIKQMGFQIFGTTSQDQDLHGQQIPYANALPGDLVGYAGHVAVFLGPINGTNYLIEAPTFGENVSIRAVYDSNEGIARYANVARYWS